MSRAPSVCSEPHCFNIAPAGRGRCPECQAAYRKRASLRRNTASERGYNAVWRKTRAAFLRAHRACEDASGCTAPATEVHHIDLGGPNGPHGHDPENLQALCHKHHGEITGRTSGFNG